MMKYWFLVVLATITADLHAAVSIRGKVRDSKTGESIVGATVYIKENPGLGTQTGLDGSFILTATEESCTVVCSCIGYKPYEFSHGGTGNIDISLEEDAYLMEQATVVAINPGRTEAGARSIERNSMNVVNVMSAKAIELSPDLTVGSVIQRMSGVTVERNAGGEGQYAILRAWTRDTTTPLSTGSRYQVPTTGTGSCHWTYSRQKCSTVLKSPSH